MDASRFSPLSGDVNQTINPWNWFARITGSQMGFINVHQVSSGDPELEKLIVEDVAGYGQQLGRVVEALSVLLATIDDTGLDKHERESLDAFKLMAKQIEQTKCRWHEGRSPLDNVDAVIAALAALRESDPERYQREREKIRTALGLDDQGTEDPPRLGDHAWSESRAM